MPIPVPQTTIPGGGSPPLFPAPSPRNIPNGGASIDAVDTTGMTKQGIIGLIENLRMRGLASATTLGVDLWSMDAADLATLYTAAVADANSVIAAAVANQPQNPWPSQW